MYNVNISTICNDLKDYVEQFKFTDFADFLGQNSDSEKLLFSTVKIYKKQNYAELVTFIDGLMAKPAAIIIPGNAYRDKDNCRSKQTTSIVIILVGSFNADGYDEGIQDLADFVQEQFLPVVEQPSIRCTRRGVVLEPTGWKPLELHSKHYDSIIVSLDAIDMRRPESQRKNSKHFDYLNTQQGE